MADERIRAVYRIETTHPLEQAAMVMAGEQSTGTFIHIVITIVSAHGHPRIKHGQDTRP